LYLFSEDNQEFDYLQYSKVFKSEVKIQKIDFLLRNPDYLAYELIRLKDDEKFTLNDIKEDIKYIYQNDEPEVKRIEMERFFFGAYEDIDDVISFLVAYGFIFFDSGRSTNLYTIKKRYFTTDFAIEKYKEGKKVKSIEWYINRCKLIKKYFGNVNGTFLKDKQYEVDEYRNTSYKTYIKSIDDIVRSEYRMVFGEEL
jgi:hypothetical protein